MNYNAHVKFVENWLDKLEAGDNATPSAAATAESPAAASQSMFGLESLKVNLWEDGLWIDLGLTLN